MISIGDILIFSYYILGPLGLLAFFRKRTASPQFLGLLIVSMVAFGLLRCFEFLYDATNLLQSVAQSLGALFPILFWAAPVEAVVIVGFAFSRRKYISPRAQLVKLEEKQKNLKILPLDCCWNCHSKSFAFGI